MTIAVRIANMEKAEDATKELFVETLRPDGSVQSFQTLKGQQFEMFYVHSNNGLRITERFADKAKR